MNEKLLILLTALLIMHTIIDCIAEHQERKELEAYIEEKLERKLVNEFTGRFHFLEIRLDTVRMEITDMFAKKFNELKKIIASDNEKEVMVSVDDVIKALEQIKIKEE